MHIIPMFCHRASVFIRNRIADRTRSALVCPILQSQPVTYRRIDSRRSRSLSTVKYIEEASLPCYDPAHYYRVRIGDVFQDQYTVKVKLGYGVTSTTWLCQDESDEYKVLKIRTSNASSHEGEAMLHLKNQPNTPEHPGTYFVRQAESAFSLFSKSGEHRCFVFSPLGPNLLDFSRRSGNTMYPEVVQVLTKILLHGVAYLHSCGIVHTDIKLDNIQLMLPEPADEAFRLLVKAENEQPSPVSHDRAGNVIYCSPVITSDNNPARAQALPYRAPEVILGATWDTKIDIWNLGVVVWELLLEERLFGQENEFESIRRMVQYLAPPPKRFIERCTKGNEFFDEQGCVKGEDPGYIPLVDRVEFVEENPLFFDFMACALKWDPLERYSASQLLEHPWMKEVKFV